MVVSLGSGDGGGTEALLSAVSDTLARAGTVEDLTRPLLQVLELVTGLESTYLTRIDLAAGLQEIVFSRNAGALVIPEGLAVSWDDTLCKRAFEDGRSFTDDVSARWGDSVAARELGICTYASTPIYLDDGRLFGTLCAASRDKRPFTAVGIEILRLFSSLISHHIQRERLLMRLREANATLEAYSFRDALTGLPNRRAALRELHRLASDPRGSGARIVVAFIDLDDFKAVNDRYGHDAGDAFLVEIGRRLGAGLAPGDMAARLGGDEFVVLGSAATSDLSDGALAEAMRSRIAPLLCGRFALEQCAFDYGGASLGVVVGDPAAVSPEEFLRRADVLMYQSKLERRIGRGAI